MAMIAESDAMNRAQAALRYSSSGKHSADALLDEREKTHGDFVHNTRISQETKSLWRATANWPQLSPAQREALDMIAHKVSRILAGDPRHQDHWDDIAGYAKLVSRELSS